MWFRIKRLEQPRMDTNGRLEQPRMGAGETGEPQINADVRRFGLAAGGCGLDLRQLLA
jgi:hypothetical protein